MSLPAPLDENGAAAPPRENGELAFEAPWESRLFGLTMALVDTGLLDWAAFRQRLLARIGAWERTGADEDWSYWQRWREALEDSLEAVGLVGQPELDRVARRLAARPHGHDHDHPRDGAAHRGHHETRFGASSRPHAAPETAEEFQE